MSKIEFNKERLKECREKINISKQEAAKRVGVSQPAYLRYESGERTPSIQVIKEMAHVFGTSSDYLCNQVEEMRPMDYVVNKEDYPEIFSLIENYNVADEASKKRILEYLRAFKF